MIGRLRSSLTVISVSIECRIVIVNFYDTMQMKKIPYIWSFIAMALFAGCSETTDDINPGKAVRFSVNSDLNDFVSGSRAISSDEFKAGHKIGVYAYYRDKNESASGAYNSNFMHNQCVAFDGNEWTYSPMKYWPSDGGIEFRAYFPYAADDDKSANPWLDYGSDPTGLPMLNYECRTGIEPLYRAKTVINAENGILKVVDEDDPANSYEVGNLPLSFTPMLNKVNFIAAAADGLYDEDENDEYKGYRFLIREFKVWGFYRSARYLTNEGKWNWDLVDVYTKDNPLDMTEYLAKVDVEQYVDGYVYNPDAGYFTKNAVVITKDDSKNIFDRSTYFIPMNGIIEGNEPRFEVKYVALTNDSNGHFRETAVVTRSGSLSGAFEKHNGLVDKIININLKFQIDGVTVTFNLSDYNSMIR